MVASTRTSAWPALAVSSLSDSLRVRPSRCAASATAGSWCNSTGGNQNQARLWALLPKPCTALQAPGSPTAACQTGCSPGPPRLQWSSTCSATWGCGASRLTQPSRRSSSSSWGTCPTCKRTIPSPSSRPASPQSRPMPSLHGARSRWAAAGQPSSPKACCQAVHALARAQLWGCAPAAGVVLHVRQCREHTLLDAQSHLVCRCAITAVCERNGWRCRRGPPGVPHLHCHVL